MPQLPRVLDPKLAPTREANWDGMRCVEGVSHVGPTVSHAPYAANALICHNKRLRHLLGNTNDVGNSKLFHGEYVLACHGINAKGLGLRRKKTLRNQILKN